MAFNAQLTAAQIATIKAKLVSACTPIELKKILETVRKTSARSKGSADGTGEDTIATILPASYKP